MTAGMSAHELPSRPSPSPHSHHPCLSVCLCNRSLDLNKRDHWKNILPGTMHTIVWKGVEDDDESSRFTGEQPCPPLPSPLS